MTQAATVPKRREQEIQRSILDLLHARGVIAWKAGAGGFRVTAPGQRERYVKMGYTGVADIIGVLPRYLPRGLTPDELASVAPFTSSRDRVGVFLAIEVKRPGQGVTEAQAVFLASVHQAGGVAFVATSCEDVARELGWT